MSVKTLNSMYKIKFFKRVPQRHPLSSVKVVNPTMQKETKQLNELLFVDFFAGKITEEELKQKLSEHPEELPYIDQAITAKDLLRELKPANAETIRAWAKVKQELKPLPRKTFYTQPAWRYAAAAIFLLSLSISLYFLMFNGRHENDTVLAENSPAIYLELSDGRIINLDETEKMNVDDKGTAIHFSKGGAVYEHGGEKGLVNTGKNKIRVPHGMTYRLALSDGTNAWLNAGTELIYPVHFGSGERRVQLRGEAYFEVKPSSAENRFMIETDRGTVVVLGTSLNVSSYTNEKLWHLTLVSGAAQLICSDASQKVMRLRPSQQLRIEGNSLEPLLLDVDTRLYTSWINDILVFENTSLREIAAKLERWYDLHFVFADTLAAKERFTGSFLKSDSKELILSTFNATERVKMTEGKENIQIKIMARTD